MPCFLLKMRGRISSLIRTFLVIQSKLFGWFDRAMANKSFNLTAKGDFYEIDRVFGVAFSFGMSCLPLAVLIQVMSLKKYK